MKADEQSIIRLLGQVITVSLETVKTIHLLPAIFDPKWISVPFVPE